MTQSADAYPPATHRSVPTSPRRASKAKQAFPSAATCCKVRGLDRDDRRAVRSQDAGVQFRFRTEQAETRLSSLTSPHPQKREFKHRATANQSFWPLPGQRSPVGVPPLRTSASISLGRSAKANACRPLVFVRARTPTAPIVGWTVTHWLDIRRARTRSAHLPSSGELAEVSEPHVSRTSNQPPSSPASLSRIQSSPRPPKYHPREEPLLAVEPMRPRNPAETLVSVTSKQLDRIAEAGTTPRVLRWLSPMAGRRQSPERDHCGKWSWLVDSRRVAKCCCRVPARAR